MVHSNKSAALLAILCGSVPAVSACGSQGPDAHMLAQAIVSKASAEAPPDAGAGAVSEDERTRVLEHFAPFVDARAAWEGPLRTGAARRAAAPFPPLVSPQDPLTGEFWLEYTSAWNAAGRPSKFLPFPVNSPVATPGQHVRLRNAASLIMADGQTSKLVRLTDFSTPAGSPRFSAMCEHYGASSTHSQAQALRDLCRTLGTVVSVSQVSDLKVDGVKLMRARECSLPSLAYGSFSGSSHTAPATSIDFSWPNYRETRASEHAQACVGAFLHVHARNDLGKELGTGWIFSKAVSDLSKVPFPYQERDPELGELAGLDGAPRGEYVSTRQLFDAGVSAYLGASPLWLVDARFFEMFTREEIAGFFGDLDTPACDFSTGEPQVPCIIPPQAPFVYPVGDALDMRQTLDTRDPQFVFGPSERNPGEEAYGSIGFFWTSVDALKFMNQTDWLKKAPVALAKDAELLSAMWHAPRLYQGRDPSFPRLRVELVPLMDNYMLAIPDQGYVQLGTPTPEFLEELLNTNLTQALAAPSACEDEDFCVSDLVREAVP